MHAQPLASRAEKTITGDDAEAKQKRTSTSMMIGITKKKTMAY
jgi:hypothetical protein